MINVYSGADGTKAGQVKTPVVFTAPVRIDVVQHVHRDISKNSRQPYAVSKKAGHQTSAESWGTGRAVARIPRVPGGGTHRAGQGAYGNMCRGGRMFAPTKTYRRWHRKVNKNQRRFAIVSALAASSSTALVMARGHRIENVSEIPLVVSNETIVNVAKTQAAIKILKALSAYADVERTTNTRKIRPGKGKGRNRRHINRRGPLIIYDQKSSLCYAFRNLVGIDLCSVNRLSLLLLAPGGHLGRFCIWTKGALERLDALYGTYKQPSHEKKDYFLPRSSITISDLGRLLGSQEIKSAIRLRKSQKRHAIPKKKNPLTNLGVMVRLNPYAKTLRRKELLRSHQRVRREEQVRKVRKVALKAKKAKPTESTEKKEETKVEGAEKKEETKVETKDAKKEAAKKKGDKQKKKKKGGRQYAAKRNPHKKQFSAIIHANK